MDRNGDTNLKMAFQEDIIAHTWTAGNLSSRRRIKHVNEDQRYILHVEAEVNRNMGPGVTKAGWQYANLMKYSVDKSTIDILEHALPSERSAVVQGASEDAKRSFVKYMAINAAVSVAGAAINRFSPAILARMRAPYGPKAVGEIETFIAQYSDDVAGNMEAMYQRTGTIETLPAGTKLYRFSHKQATEKHYFTTDIEALPGDVGLNPFKMDASQVVFEEFTLTKPVEVLKSRVNLINEAGAEQVFSPQIQKSSTSRILKDFGEP